MTAPHLRAGRQSELIAKRWLLQQGLRPVISNYRCRAGELDLIMLDHGCLAIIEVRYRRSDSHGGALQSISRTKQQRIARATLNYLQDNECYRHYPLRFDALTLTGSLTNPVIEWRRRAFVADALL